MLILNVVDHDTNFQWCGRVPDRTALEIWKDFSKGWWNCFGPPPLLSDGGSEFKGEFERVCEHWSCFSARDFSGRSSSERSMRTTWWLGENAIEWNIAARC